MAFHAGRITSRGLGRGRVTLLINPRNLKSSRPEPNRAEPSRAEPSRTEPNRTEPNRTEPNRTEPTFSFRKKEAKSKEEQGIYTHRLVSRRLRRPQPQDARCPFPARPPVPGALALEAHRRQLMRVRVQVPQQLQRALAASSGGTAAGGEEAQEAARYVAAVPEGRRRRGVQPLARPGVGLRQVGLPRALEGEAGVRVEGEGLLEARHRLVHLADLALDRADLRATRGGGGEE